MSEAPIRIDDLAAPRWPLLWRLANRGAAPFAKRAVKLDEASLLATARRREKLEDFGGESFRVPLRVLLDSLEREANLSPLGRAMSRQLLLGLLATRLRLAALLREHPEIRDERIEAPVVILGLPRTGTTHLHNLLGEVPELRSLPYWKVSSRSLRRRCAKAARPTRAASAAPER